MNTGLLKINLAQVMTASAGTEIMRLKYLIYLTRQWWDEVKRGIIRDDFASAEVRAKHV